MREPNPKGIKSPFESDKERIGTTRTDSTVVYNEDGTVDSTPVGHKYVDTSGDRYAQSMKKLRDDYATKTQHHDNVTRESHSYSGTGMSPTLGL